MDRIMKIKYFMFFYLILVCSCTLTSTSPNSQGPKQAVGTVTGMVLGGKIANDLAEDSSKKNFWTIAGVTLGAFMGNEIGAYMDKTDILMAQNARTLHSRITKPIRRLLGIIPIVEILGQFIQLKL